MNIYAEKGTKIRFSNPDAGYTPHQETAKDYLRVGVEYTVDHTDVGNWHTDVYIAEVPDTAFNSVMFEEVN